MRCHMVLMMRQPLAMVPPAMARWQQRITHGAAYWMAILKELHYVRGAGLWAKQVTAAALVGSLF
jgi:hypothetical protein